LLRAAPAVGALLTSRVLTRRPLRRQVGRTLLTTVALFGLCMLVFGFSGSLWSMLALATSCAADTASNQFGEFESGVNAEWWGPVHSVVLGGVGTLLIAAGWMRLFPVLAKRDRLERPG